MNDRVELKEESTNTHLRPGDTGIVCHPGADHPGSIGIRWNHKINGHDCDHHCEDGHGWYVPLSKLILLTELTDPTDGDVNIMEIL